MFIGIGERMTKELRALAPSEMAVRVVAEPGRKYSAWMGGAQMTEQTFFKNMWIFKSDYDEIGPTIVHSKCP